MQDTQPPRQTTVATWRIILAIFLDALTAFMVFGYLIAVATGNTTDTGFQLNGMPALVLFALVIAYFVIGNRTGGTLWKRILGVPVRWRAVKE